MPEFTAPGLGRESNRVTIDAELRRERARACSTRSAAPRGGLALYMDKGQLVYEYNMMIIERYEARSPAGSRRASTGSRWTRRSRSPAAPAEVVLAVDGAEVARTTVKRTVPAAFTASESFDVGVDLGSPVFADYFDRRPFPVRRDDRRRPRAAEMKTGSNP